MKTATGVLDRAQSPAWWIEAALVASASLFVALCARVTVPLPFTPVPLTLQNFAVLLVGLALGSRRGFAALALYLVEGALGLPVFNPTGLGGIAQVLGPTGGYLMAYPVVAFLSGWIAERGAGSFRRYAVAAVVGEVVLFAGGLAWLTVWTRGSWWQAAHFGLYPFVFAEVAKVMAAAGLAARLPIRATLSRKDT
ncbi:MAG TPA: biotin transporter BioY [Terriglobales bacterium]|nr:biotin transporter BioY [Terriglobales bacterium]